MSDPVHEPEAGTGERLTWDYVLGSTLDAKLAPPPVPERWEPDSSGGSGDCATGSEKCHCTTGGACDPGLVCLSETCVKPSGADAGPDSASGGASGAGGVGGSAGGTTDGAAGTDGSTCSGGCSQVDVLFALDGAGNSGDQNNAVSAAIDQIVPAISSLNCGTDFRIGVTDENDGGWYAVNSKQWFDSKSMSASEIGTAFKAATAQRLTGTGTPTGCSHVLSSAVNLLSKDTSGFVRGGALLVLVLVTRGDDYGAYDQLGGNSCGFGCSTAPPSLDSLKTSLLGVKSNDPKAITVIAVAGAPSAASGADFCGRPGCGCSGADCIASPGTRLEAFTQLFSAGKSGVEDACAGMSTAGSAIQTAIQSRAAPACKAL